MSSRSIVLARLAGALASKPPSQPIAVRLCRVQPLGLDDDALAQRVTDALEERVVVEQAKGALAYQLSLDMADAYDELAEARGRQRLPAEADGPGGPARRAAAVTWQGRGPAVVGGDRW